MRRPGDAGLLASGFAIVLLAAVWVHADLAQLQVARDREQRAGLVRDLGLTDPVLFTESQHTRRPALVTPETAFLNHPLALDAFPSGSLVPVPARRDPGEGPP